MKELSDEELVEELLLKANSLYCSGDKYTRKQFQTELNKTKMELLSRLNAGRKAREAMDKVLDCCKNTGTLKELDNKIVETCSNYIQSGLRGGV